MRPLFTAALLALATPALPWSVEPLPTVDLTGGAEQPLTGTEMMVLVTRVDDQRCPAGVDCYWEGMIRVELTVLGPDESQQDITLCNLCDDATRSATVDGIEFTLIGLFPSQDDLAKLGRAPVLSDYRLTLSYGPAIR
jgi:hypothetical protein